MTEMPYFKYGNLPAMPDNKKYKERKPIIAKMFDEYTKKVSCVMDNTAGMESTAKIRSLISTTITAAKSGVANHLPAGSFTKKFSPW